MKQSFIIALTILTTACSGTDSAKYINISNEEMTDKVRGAWAGKMIGVMYGRPMEFQCTDRMYTDPVIWSPENVTAALNEDDIYGQMNFMMTMERIGADAPIDSLARSFAEAEFALCHANLQARKNYLDGIPASELSTPANNIHGEDIDFQIECDFIGFINPGMPARANELCERVGRIMAASDGLYAGMYVSSLHTLAYIESDLPAIVRKALGSIPSESTYAQCITDVIDAYETDSLDWQSCWTAITEKWGPYDVCTPEHAFNIDAKLNGAYVVMGLLYGGSDWKRTMDITVACGQDTDCNTATAAAVLGVLQGYEAIPEEFRSHIPEIADEKFIFTNYSYNDAVTQTLALIAGNVTAGGGDVTPEGYKIKLEEPVAPEYEPGLTNLRLKEKVNMAQPERWNLTGVWEDFVYGDGDYDLYRVATQPGDAAELNFDGTGVALLGSWNTDGGRADVFIDGEKVKTVNTYFITEAGKFEGNRAYIFLTFGLEPGKHTVKIVNLPEASPHSTGNKIYLERALIYE